MTCRTNGGVKLQDHEMTHIDPRKADGRKNEPVKQDTHQIEDTSRSRMTRNIRLGFVIPATKIEQRKRPSQQTTKDCLPINTWDLTKTTTSTTITELGTQKSHLNNNHQEEFNPGHPLSSGRSTDEPADERTRRPVSVTTPRVRSDRPTTRPIHLGPYYSLNFLWILLFFTLTEISMVFVRFFGLEIIRLKEIFIRL